MILSNRILIFSSLIFLLSILLSNLDSFGKNDIVGVYYDNSISSQLGSADLKVEESLNRILSESKRIVFFDNEKKERLDKNSLIEITKRKTLSTQRYGSIFEKFDNEGFSRAYLISDYQTGDLTELKSLTSDSIVNYHFVVTNSLQSFRNVSIDSLYFIPNEENLSELSILVDFNTYNLSGGSVVIKLMQGTKQLSSVVKDVSELNLVRFDLSKDNYGFFEIVVNGDDVGFDDVFHFVISEKVKSQITIINSPKSKILEKVFDNAELFDVDTQDAGNLDFERLQLSDLVVLSGLNQIPQVFSSLPENVNLIAFPSDTIDIDSYQDFLNLRMIQVERELVETNIDSDHPILRGVFDENVQQSSLSEIELFRFENEFEPIINFRNGNPFLLKKDNIFFFNSALDLAAGRFHSNALFLPILYQVAFVSGNGLEVPYYYPGDKLITQTERSDIPIKLQGENYEIIPSFNSSNSQLIVEIPKDIQAGKYVMLQGNDTLQNVAVNVPKEESAMESLEMDELEEAFTDIKNVQVSDLSNGVNDMLLTKGSRSSLWKYALILVLLLIITETVLHRYLR